MKQQLIDILACPDCKTVLGEEKGNGRFFCPSCQCHFDSVNGVPILLTAKNKAALDAALSQSESQSMVEGYLGKQSLLDLITSKIRRPTLLFHTKPQFRNESIRNKVYETNGKDTLVLSVGGGPTRDDPREVNLNIGLFPNVDVVGDGYQLPFADNSFDSVMSRAVMEHVEFPRKIMDEMYRVLKKGGTIYTEAPFIFFYHSYPSDFYRYTKTGLEHICSQFKKVESGIVCGPTSAMLETANAYFLLFIPERFLLLRKALSGLFRLVFWPFKYLDLWLNKKDASHIVSAGFYFLGQKE